MNEVIEVTDRDQAIGVLAAAFKDHPMMPPDPRGWRTRTMLGTLLKVFRNAPDAQTFGIHRDGRLACAAFVFADGYEPGKLATAGLMFQMLRAFGPRQFRTLVRAMSQKHEAGERRLELLLLGTRSEHQGQGLGRIMLQHVYAFAGRKGYDTVTLEVAKDTPAFGFYQSEGFEVEKEIDMPKMPLVMMGRRIASASPEAPEPPGKT